MLFLGVISWKGTSCFNGGLFFRWGSSFLSWGCAQWEGMGFDGVFWKKIVEWEGVRNLGHLPGKKICILYELGNKMQVKSGGHCESLSGFTEEPQGKAP